MKCKLCEKFYKKYPLKKRKGIGGMELVHEIEDYLHYSPIECSFETGVFKEAWGCRTMITLRKISEEEDTNMITFYARDDIRSASIGVVQIPETEKVQQGYLVMTWYKDRGRTGQAWVMWDDNKPEPLALKTAEYILKNSKTLLDD